MNPERAQRPAGAAPAGSRTGWVAAGGSRVPPAARHERTFSDPADAFARLRGARILVVEDDSLSAHRLSRLLASFGCEVVGPTASPDEARRLVVRRPAAAVLDDRMGTVTTFGLAEDLAARGVAILLVTAQPPEHMPPRLRGYPQLSKPFTPSALAGALLSIVG